MSTGSRGRWLSPIYALTIFVSAFLLFQVQPIISKAILPWFGGSPAVWTTAMLFFQTLLFFGYAYAHFSQSLRRPLQVGVHLLLLVAAVAMLPILPGGHWKPADGSDPAGRILLLLAVNVGLPYFVLSTTGPLVQAWFSRTNPGCSPYRLYSLSNIGSLLALLSYPFLVEPAATLGTQARVWQAGFWLFAALCGYGAWRAATSGPDEAQRPDGVATGGGIDAAIVQPAAGGLMTAAPVDSPDAPAPGWGARILWIALPAFGSLALLATTNHICQDLVPAIPFLWVLPLSLYLLSFIICFDHERWYWPRLLATLALLLILAGFLHETIGVETLSERLTGRKVEESTPLEMRTNIVLCFAGMFCVCMLCHGELVRLKPHPRHLTMFYLLVSAGGAIGGLFVSLIAPHVFQSYAEWRIGLLVAIALATAVLLGTGAGGLFRRHIRLFVPGLVIFASVMFFAASRAAERFEDSQQHPSELLAARRNFYGVVTVTTDYEHKVRRMRNGSILHGMQIESEAGRLTPTTYYGRVSGVGRAIDHFQFHSPLPSVRIGAVGLGTGTLAAYARLNDQFTFYEINPVARSLAEEYFSFLGDAAERMQHGSGRLEIVMGDGRLSLERRPDDAAKFNVIVVDAFTGDSIPMHLLTREAADIYSRQLAPDGVLAIHITNHYLDLKPVVRGMADHMGLKTLQIESGSGAAAALYDWPSDWMLVTNNAQLLKSLQEFAADEPGPERQPVLWTDDYCDLYGILK